jgi:predicted RNA-binding Zn ribbon-like protein
MKLSDKFPVPSDIALLYDFVNSLDLRRYVEQGVAHVVSDELATKAQLESWLSARELSPENARLSEDDLRKVLALREALRSFIQLSPNDREANADAAAQVNAAAVNFPLTLKLLKGGDVALRPLCLAPASGLGTVLAELQQLAATDRLDRLKMCASEECHWVFFDRSKPANRRWCNSALCGNRQKTRAYRERRRGITATHPYLPKSS